MSAQKGAAEALRREIERQRVNLEAEGFSLQFDSDADTDIGELIICVSSAAATGTFRVDNGGFGHFSVLHSSSNQHVNQVTWDQLSPKQTIDRFAEFIGEMQEVRDEIPANNAITVQFWDWFRNSYRKSQLPSSPWVAENFSMSATENLAKNPPANVSVSLLNYSSQVIIRLSIKLDASATINRQMKQPERIENLYLQNGVAVQNFPELYEKAFQIALSSGPNDNVTRTTRQRWWRRFIGGSG